MQNNSPLHLRFEIEYKKLNQNQKQAVDTIDGPVMVLAGPGTGKTQILATRIANILLKTDTNYENILCLTYSEAGSIAMRKRLVQIIGSDAYRIAIHTYHSFCNTVIRENFEYFERQNLEIVTDLEKLTFIRQIIDGLDNQSLLKRLSGDIYYDQANLKKLFEDIKKEGYKVDELIKNIDKYIEYEIPEEYNDKIKLKKGIEQLTKKGEAEVVKMKKLQDAVSLYPQYQKKLNDAQRYDFDDMINWVIDLFEKKEDILLNYQEKFQYFLVDEYQDTNGAQLKILKLLLSYWEGEDPNVFVVGDDDQSIYSFQGANLRNMHDFQRQYLKERKPIVLTQNYRSTQQILDAAKGLIENNQERLVNHISGLTKDLIASNEALKAVKDLPKIIEYENGFAENVHLVETIKSLLANGVNPSRIAIIYKENFIGDDLIKYLQTKQIPFYAKRPANLLDDPFFIQLQTIIKYVVAELESPFSGEPSLFELMHFPFFNIPAIKIALISFQINQYKLIEKKTFRGYLQNLVNENAKTLFTKEENDEGLLKLASTLENLISSVNTYIPQQWVERLVYETGMLTYILKHDEKLELLNKLHCIFNFIKDASARNKGFKLADILDQISLMKDNNLALPFIYTYGNEAGVHLLTCHGSKGLEYEYVFFKDTHEQLWEGKTLRNKGFVFPPKIIGASTEAKSDEEIRRLFFVSVTRAEKYLTIMYKRFNDSNKELQPSKFVEEFKKAHELKTEKIEINEADFVEYSSLHFNIIHKPVLAAIEKSEIDKRIASFALSASSLNSYIECPLKFYFNFILKIPSAESVPLFYGNAVHTTFERLFTHSKSSVVIYPDKNYFINSFFKALQKGEGLFTSEAMERMKLRGEKALGKYYENYLNPAPENDFIAAEYNADNVFVEGVPIKGKIDKIQFWGKDIELTDFKTGKYKAESLSTMSNEKHPEGGAYWRQAAFYNILINNLPKKDWKIVSTKFEYIEPDEKGDFKQVRLIFDDEEIAFVTNQIKTTWGKIKNHEFYTGCGKKECYWCNFLKNNKAYSSLIEEKGVAAAEEEND